MKPNKTRAINAPTVIIGCVLGVTTASILIACDTGARKDLSNENQRLDNSEATVIVMPDKFPNITHKCLEDTGFWTTTNAAVWIVYNDPSCGGEGDVLILDNIPGSQAAQS